MQSDDNEQTAVDTPGDALPHQSVADTSATVSNAWLQIQESLQAAQAENALTSNVDVYKVWVRWLHTVSKSSDAGDVFCCEEYWSLLQQGFRPSSAEQRRYCLYILGKSIALLDQDVNVSCFAYSAGDVVFREAYETYCTLFSTFVLDRYINQVEECLPKLRDLAAPAGQVDPSWVIILLGAALDHGVQDSVRKTLGEDFMQWSLMDFPATAVWSTFFSQSFLPWACQGYLFTTSVTKTGSEVRCAHGERLAIFIDRIVNLYPDADEMLSFARLLLQYIVDTPKLFPYAGVYILDGLLRALNELATEVDLSFGNVEKDLASKVAKRKDLPEMAREAWNKACRDLCQLGQQQDGPRYKATSESAKTSLQNSLLPDGKDIDLMLDPVVAASSSTLGLLSTDGSEDLSLLNDLLKRTSHRCLRGEGLLQALAFSKRSLKTSTPDEAVLHNVLLAIWTEVEIQDYPKAALIQLPEIIFTDRVLNVCFKDPESLTDKHLQNSVDFHMEHPHISDLHGLVLEIWHGLVSLSRGRIYVLAKLTRVLHALCLSSPSQERKESQEAVTSDGHVRILPLTEFLVQIATDPPRSKIEFRLEAAVAPLLTSNDDPVQTYRSYYGEPEGVAYAYLFDLLNRGTFNPTSIETTLNKLLKPWLEQQQPLVIVSKWKNTLQLQLMLLLIRQITESSQLESYFAKFCKVLALEPMPRYRYLLQWIIITIYAQAHQLGVAKPENNDAAMTMATSFIEPLRKVEHDNPKYIGSVLKICVAICKLENPPAGYPLQLMTAMVAMCASPKIVIRHEAQWSFAALWTLSKARRWTMITDNPVLAALSDYIRSLDRYINPPPERLLEDFDFVRDNTLTHLFQGDYLLIDPSEAPLVTHEDFLYVHNQAGQSLDSDYQTHPDEMRSLQSQTVNCESRIPLGTTHSHRAEVSAKQSDAPTPGQQDQHPIKTKAPLQTKASSWQTVLDTLSDPSLNPSLKRHVRPIIVFASHIASTVNLGGLSRAAEVFGAEALVVAKADVVKDKAFLGVSVNSHLHFSIQEVKSDERTVLAWLMDRRAEGYGVVGVEQTDRSVVLGQKDKHGRDVAAFPERCVLVMGSEKEGIPGWLLAECDAGCVEIPQVGVTRSLNVQTAAAVALYEYGRQLASK